MRTTIAVVLMLGCGSGENVDGGMPDAGNVGGDAGACVQLGDTWEVVPVPTLPSECPFGSSSIAVNAAGVTWGDVSEPFNPGHFAGCQPTVSYEQQGGECVLRVEIECADGDARSVSLAIEAVDTNASGVWHQTFGGATYITGDDACFAAYDSLRVCRFEC